MKTLAAVLYGVNDLRLEELEIPALGEGECLVRVNYSGLCGTQLGELRGWRGDDPHYPHLFGHEGHGTVLEGPKDFVGQNVILSWVWPGGGPIKYRHVNSGPIATLSKYVVVHKNKVIPTDLDPELATLLGCAIPTATSALRYKPEGAVAIIGLGGVGLSVLAGLPEKQIVHVYERNEAKIAFAIALKPNTFRGQGSCGFQVVYECTGSASGITQALDIGHTVVLVGNTRHGETISIDPNSIVKNQKCIVGVSGARTPASAREIHRKLIGKVGKLEDIVSLFDELEQGAVNGRILVKMDH